MKVKIKEVFDKNKVMKNAVIEGEIVNVDIRETKKESFLVKIDVYDGTSTMTASFFNKEKPEFNTGEFVSLEGKIEFDKYNRGELTMKPKRNGGVKKIGKKVKKKYDDGAGEKHRVSLQNFTFMTAKRGAVPVEKYFELAKKLNHKAIGVTDLGVVQSFPEMAKLSRKTGVKAIYGMTALTVGDTVMVYNYKNKNLIKTPIVVFDTETTGLSARYNDLIEIGAAKIENMKVVDTFQVFIKTGKPVPKHIEELTKITSEMLEEEGVPLQKALKMFDEFVGDAMLAAHNAFFDLSILEEAYIKAGFDIVKRPLIDTLKVSRKLNEDIKDHRLGSLAKKYGVSLKNAHRADDDSRATAEIFVQMMKQLKDEGIETTEQLQNYKTHLNYLTEFPTETTIWVKNQKGLKNLYEIVSQSHTKYLSSMGDVNNSGRPVVPWSLIEKYREGLIIGSGGYQGHLFELAYEKPDRYVEKEIDRYDVIQIEPADVARHLAISDKPKIDKESYIEDTWKTILRLAKKHNKFVIATDGAHYTEKEDALIHNILVYSQLPPKRDHHIRQGKMDYPLGPAHMRTTKEMLESFPYLSDEEKEKYIITNTNILADKIEVIEPIPVDEKGDPILYTPKIDGIDEEFEKLAFENARKQYGDPLPPLVENRLRREIDAIIGNGYAVIYMISRKLVKKSLEDGYLVGSRGSVGSSFAATMTEITEVNPLPPHYFCTDCKWNIFFEGNEEILSGYDLPNRFKDLLNKDKFSEEGIHKFVQTFAENFGVQDLKKIRAAMEKHDGTCPNCKKNTLKKEGQNIPFETFLGFNGDKVPDIDLNFSGIYQSKAHEYTKVLFGEDKVFRAGTITTVAEMTAFAFVNNYFNNHNVKISTAETNRIAAKIVGAKDSTGQHPGGILVVPDYMEMTDISPYQYPANNTKNSFMTSHFNFESIHDNILKLDILGHEAPTLLRYLEDYTEISPREVPSADEKTLELFTRPEAVLKIHPKEYFAKTGTLGLPEMGTRVVQDVIYETKPESFGDLITLSGLTHGTNVYYNNAQELIQNGVASIREVIGCRDDIMRYLISKGLDKSLSFTIMESVRKGRGLKPEWEEEMKKHKVPDWYIWSCKQIEYMFPRAHASAYVLDATRTGYYKVNYPLEYTAAVFSAKYSNENLFDLIGSVEESKQRYKEIEEEIRELQSKGEYNAANKKQKTKTALNLAIEAKLRGIKFGKIRLYESHSYRFLMDKENNELIPPFSTVPGLGEKVAEKLYKEKFKGVFRGIPDLKKRTKIETSTIDLLRTLGALEDIEEFQPTLY